MTKNVIININKSEDDNFNSLLNATRNALNSVIFAFTDCFKLSKIDEFMQLVKYDYSSLQITSVYNLLNLLGITYSENIPQQRAIDNMTDTNSFHSTDEEMNRKRVKRIKASYDKRNISHAAYLNSPVFSPKILAEDSLWYEILSDFPILKRFLFNEEAIIKKKFFDDLNLVYKKINTYCGYDRFKLMYKLEVNSKLELFYKILTSIKQKKRRLKLIKSEVENMIDKMYHLHIVPYNHPNFFIIASYSDNMRLFDEILRLPYNTSTVNNIVFNVDKLADYYTESPTSTIDIIKVLNFIHNTVVYHLCCEIGKELSLSDDQTCFTLIKHIQNCKAATAYFDDYINSNTIVNMHKDCSKDITFTHFKRIYKLKPGPSKKQK